MSLSVEIHPETSQRLQEVLDRLNALRDKDEPKILIKLFVDACIWRGLDLIEKHYGFRKHLLEDHEID